jgi:radical SAM superfamily enzyme YgiQ (UPF0313 family)
VAKKVLFVNPSWDGLVSKRGRRYNRAWPPLDLLYGAALAEAEGAEARLLDARARPATADEVRAAGAWAELVVLTSSPLDRWQCPNIDLERLREFVQPLPAHRLFVTGVHGTANPEQMLELTGARGVLRGDAEFPVRDLVRGRALDQIGGLARREGGAVIRNPDAPPVEMDDLPTPAYHLLEPDRYRYELVGDRFTLFEASRGCPFSCNFCSLLMYGRRVRFRDPARVAEDVRAAIERGGARCGYFIDLEFTVNRKWVLAVCEALRRRVFDFAWCVQTRADTVDLELLRAMRAAGCRLVHYGVESGTQDVMQQSGKGMDLETVVQAIRWTEEAGMESACFFMVGLRGERPEQMQETIEFAKRLNPTYASFHVATPYPGSPWYPIAGALPGALYAAESFDDALPKDELARMARRGTREFYLRAGYIASRIRRGDARSWARQAKLFLSFVRS